MSTNRPTAHTPAYFDHLTPWQPGQYLLGTYPDIAATGSQRAAEYSHQIRLLHIAKLKGIRSITTVQTCIALTARQIIDKARSGSA